MRRLSVFAVAAILMFSSTTIACLWDYDTLKVERQQFPNTLELITGKFLRHSPEYYRWRVADREKKLKASPSALMYDDLAVAHEKLGNHEKAIEVTLEKEKQFPGLYETRANLGTFYIHAGDLQRGATEIEAAIAINPDAHFGREEYQKMLVEYVLAARVKLSANEDATVDGPLQGKGGSLGFAASGFAKYVLEAKGIPKEEVKRRQSEIDKATKGVLGMMRFGNHDSPILLEALGDLLISRGYPSDAKRLAARAFLKASYGSQQPAARDAFRELAKKTLRTQTAAEGKTKALTVQWLERTFKLELKAADEWYNRVEADEKKWIQSGVDVDKAYSKKYYRNPKAGI